MADCLFCKIAHGEIPAQILYQDEQVLAFKDIDPKAPVHVLVIPRQHVGSAAELGPGNGPLLAAMLLAANRVADETGVADTGYRLVFNVGSDAGVAVAHLHLHVLGGRKLSWPPG